MANQVDEDYDDDEVTHVIKSTRSSTQRSTLTYQEQRRKDYSLDAMDYDGRLQDSFFQYVKRNKDYDQNEVPWEDGDKPVQVKMSAYLR